MFYTYVSVHFLAKYTRTDTQMFEFNRSSCMNVEN